MRTVRADFHNHLQTSGDMDKLDFEKVVKYASGNLGKGGIFGVTNMKDKRFERLMDKFSMQMGNKFRYFVNGCLLTNEDLAFVKNQEVVTYGGGHILGIGLPYGITIPDQLSVEETLDAIQEAKGFTCVDHPFGKAGLGQYFLDNRDLLESGKVDFWESYNGEAGWIPLLTPRGANEKAQRVYDETIRGSHIGEIYGSDGHSPEEIGRCYVEMQMPEKYDKDSMRQDLVKGMEMLKESAVIGEVAGEKQSSTLRAVKHVADLAFLLGPQLVVNQIRKK